MKQQLTLRFDKQTFALLAFSLLMLIFAGIAFAYHLVIVKQHIEAQFQTRYALVNKFVSLHRNQVAVMKGLIVEGYGQQGPVSDTLVRTDVPHTQSWIMTDKDSKRVGFFTGSRNQPIDAQLSDEIAATLKVDGQVRSILSFDADVAWIYYQSSNQFMYLAPRVSPEVFHFDDAVYQQRYWTEALFANNPEQKMVLAGPYDDMGGKGKVITFSDPVYVNGVFKGVCALDLTVNTLDNLLAIGQTVGESMLISENDRVMSRSSGIHNEQFKRPPLSNALLAWQQDSTHSLWLSAEVVPGQMWLVHEVKRWELLLAVVKESALTWFLLIILTLVVVSLVRMKRAFSVVSHMTYVDPLTEAFNRRGFYEKLPVLKQVAARQQQILAVAIMDIDFFKKINDQFGHAEGDSVLKQLSALLKKNVRVQDMVCRWGGEEFVLIFLVNAQDDLPTFVERIRTSGEHIRIAGTDYQVTLSAGLVYLQPDEDVDHAVARADELLYQAKENGRNRLMCDLTHGS